MRIVLAGLVIALELWVAAPTCAQTYSVIGPGNSSCGTWAALWYNPHTINALEDESWMVGFLSGIGFVSPQDDPLHGMDADGVGRG
jgi:hypothetical protein